MASEEAPTKSVVKVLAPEVMKRVDALTELQTKYNAEYAKFVAEKKALELKYQAAYADLYKARADIVSGAVEPEGAAAAAAGAGAKGIPDFWLQALQNQSRIGRYIEEHDVPALKALSNITVAYLDEFQGFKITFHFDANEFFTNETLSKTFHIPDMLGGRQGSDPTVEKLEATEINWKADKNLTVKTIKKTVKKKGKKSTIYKSEPQDSFFDFFAPVDLDAEPEGMQEALDLQDQVQSSLSIGFALRDKVIPRAVDWFTGEAVADDSDDEDDEDDDYEDDEEGDDDDEDDDDDAPKKGRGGGGGGKAGKKHKDDDDDEEEEEDGDDEDTRAALAAAFKKSAKVSGGKGGKDKDGEPKGGAPGAPGGDKPAECKQQ